MNRGITYLMGGICILCNLTARAETYPEPEKKSIVAVDMAAEKEALLGKVVKVQFNRISSIQKVKDGVYAGDLRSQSKPELRSNIYGEFNHYSDKPGVWVQFPTDGLGVLSKFVPNVGGGINDITPYTNVDSGSVYVLVGDKVSLALGDRYKGDGEYAWSKKTKIPELSDAKKVSVTDLLLYPEQLNGRVIELDFYYADGLKKGTTNCAVTVSSSDDGHQPISIDFPADGLGFFEEAVNQDKKILKARTVFAAVEVSSSGKISVKALGTRRQGKGAEAEYKW